MAIWYNLWQFVVIWNIFPIFVCLDQENLATLIKPELIKPLHRLLCTLKVEEVKLVITKIVH
jgi:hypothetical protein